MRKGLSILLILTWLITISPAANAQLTKGSFPDVEPTYKYYTAIEYFHVKDVIEGYEDGTFRPDQPANRAEALKIILLSSDIVVEEDLGGDVFPDVTNEDWFYTYIKKAAELGIVDGYDDGYFRPVQNLNIAETLKIIILANGISVVDPEPGVTIFPDVTPDLWFAPYAAYSKEKNIIEPQADGNFNAGRVITRGELVELMYRTEIVLQNEGEPFDMSTNWPLKSFPEFGFKAKVPFDWEIVNNQDEVVLWHPDVVNHQSSYEVPFPFGSSMTFHLDENKDELTPAAYTANLEMVYKSDFGTYQKGSLTIAGYDAINLKASIVNDDYFVFYPDKKVLHIYTSYGWSDLTPHLEEQIGLILKNMQYLRPQSNASGDIMTDARNNILVEGLGQETLDMFDDLVNIDTDTIGVGTGPIDYFYTFQYDVTIKYERESSTVLDIQSGNTSAF